MTIFYVLLSISAIVGYLFGGINGAIILSKTVFGKDIREYGSKNPGFTNYKRVFGNGISTWCVMLIDIAKTLVPVLVFSKLFAYYNYSYALGASITGLFCMIGHAYPVWYKFKGGKTFMAFATTVWFVDLRMALIFLTVFLLVLFTIKYMSLSSMLAAASCPVSVLFLGYDHKAVPCVMMACAVLLIWRHKENIKRLVKRTESKFSLFSKKSMESKKTEA
ncbi:MAG: glycerol-3-phosphate 1-O-acyltransferase PlsY [Ruminococcaceae bacterium]|nr:glycerol-3-phosphate 1-O-acyltransferase PlsY [Oscillospiraceae bacterium]